MAEHGDRVVPHLHLCLQSGSDAVLRRMRRRWGTRTFLNRCHLLRQSLECPAITTDVITGFPGETESEFAETLATCRSAGFSKIHAFPFSPRRGTPAAEMSDQVPKSLRSERVARLTELEAELRREYYNSLIGREVELLVESHDGGRSRGTTCRYAPGEIESVQQGPGDLVRGRVISVDGKRLNVASTLRVL